MADRVIQVKNGQILQIGENKDPLPAAQLEW
jgi:hypothetical protein